MSIKASKAPNMDSGTGTITRYAISVNISIQLSVIAIVINVCLLQFGYAILYFKLSTLIKQITYKYFCSRCPLALPASKTTLCQIQL